MLSDLDADLFIFLGAFLQTSAMLFQNQVVLRLLFLVGGSCYISYYIYGFPDPLWGAVAASATIFTTTLIGLVSLLLGRSRALIPRELLNLYEQMGNMNPGEFRLLLKSGRRRKLLTEETLTEQGQKPEKLFFIEAGHLRAHKNGHVFTLPAGIFVGEVAFMTGAAASASVYAAADSEIVEWNAAALRKQTQRKDKLRLALDAQIAQDLAAKVARAVGPT